MPKNLKIAGVPTNLITGFLGVGKTSAILHLLRHKPARERWAVLVNEFGEMGVDGGLFRGQHAEEAGVFVREVPGGCMCCAAGLPMQLALNALLRKARPDRLLIEPTGLGHPVEVLRTLATEPNQDVLTLEKVITLVDARKLADSRYTEHATFNQQIAMADMVVGNKQDLYAPGDQERLQAYVKTQNPFDIPIVATAQGVLDPAWLSGKTRFRLFAPGHPHLPSTETQSPSDAPIPRRGYLQATHAGEGFTSMGWRFAANQVFSRDQLRAFFRGLTVERMKATCITEQGGFGYNGTRDGFTETALAHCAESRVEIIAAQADDRWEEQLLACAQHPHQDES